MSSEQLAVSVVIPVYNVAAYLGECLDSVLGQTMPADRYEVIAVDDGSSDGSLAILQDYAGRHPSLSVVSIPRSGSAAAPRNTGIEQARGRYLFFVDADDVLAPTALADLSQVGDETGSDVILGRMANLGDGTRPMPTSMFTRNHRGADFVESSAYKTLGCWKMFRRSLVEQHRLRFATGFRIGEDLPFTMKAYLVGNHVSALSDRPYYFLRTRTDGSNTTWQGQSPEHNLRKNLAVIRVVEEHTEPGPRRDLLLARSFTDKAGLRVSFDLDFALLGRADQEALIARAGTVAHLWTDGLRQHADAEARVVLDLLFAGHVDELTTVARRLGARQPLPLRPADDGRGFGYVAGDGTTVTDVPTRLSATLTSCGVVGRTLRSTGWLVARGVAEPPDAVRLVWRLRGRDRELAVPPESVDAVAGDADTRIDAAFAVDLAALRAHGTWDAYLEGRWGEVVLHGRLGWRTAEPDTAATAIGVPTESVVFFTPRYHNLSVDVGASRDHPVLRRSNRLGRIVPRGRAMVVVVEGPVADGATLEVGRAGRARTAPAVLDSVNALTHLAEVRLRLRPGRYRFTLGPDRTPLLPGDHAAPRGWRLIPAPDGIIELTRAVSGG